MDPLADVLLRRLGQVPLPPADAAPTDEADAAPLDGAGWVAVLEADLARRGWVLHHELRTAAARLAVADRNRWGDWLLAAVDALVGADRDLTPLIRTFPQTPHDIEAVFVDRLLTHYFATVGAPCVLCARDEVGAPLDPCGHLVCRDCFPPERYSGCPICGRRITAGSGYLPTTEAPDPDAQTPLAVRLLRLDPAPKTTAADLRDTLVTRPGALSPADRTDLTTVIAATVPTGLGWLPADVPARETLAVVLAWALHASARTETHAEVIAAAAARWHTATDAARTLWAYSGGDPGLILNADTEQTEVRVRALPRPLRRAVLEHLDACGAPAAAEDLGRHPTVWKRLGERLHPFERATAASVAFAALRGTRTPAGSKLGAAMIAAVAADPRRLVLDRQPSLPTPAGSPSGALVSVRVRTHAAEVEAALEAGDPVAAARLLSERPGTLWRRLDHLLRLADPGPGPAAVVLAAAAESVARVAPGVLATAAAELAGRDATVPAPLAAPLLAAVSPAAASPAAASPASASPASASPVLAASLLAAGLAADLATVDPGDGPRRSSAPLPGTPRRLFFPSGDVVRTWTEPERRGRITRTSIDAVRRLVDRELTGRAGRGDRFDVAIIDAALADVPAPLRERAGSGQLAGWPRGSRRTLPPGPVLRLFLHWTEAAERVDLDLSAAFLGADWASIGHCDYTRLRFAEDAAVHSGDFTSAPQPAGATEFLDLDLAKLVEAGARYAVPVVFSYNSIPFDRMTEAFAGLSLPGPGGAPFDAGRVAQRFDLRGNARVLMPMVVDLTTRELLWTDLSLPARGNVHEVQGHGGKLARAAADQWEYFGSRPRPTLLDVAAWHAAGRAARVFVAYPDGSYTEVAADVAAIRSAAAAGGASPAGGAGHGQAPAVGGKTVLAAVVDAGSLAGFGPETPEPGSVALSVTGRTGPPWQAVGAADLLGQLIPVP